MVGREAGPQRPASAAHRRIVRSEAFVSHAVSFAVMRRERITRALTFDRHFALAEYENPQVMADQLSSRAS